MATHVWRFIVRPIAVGGMLVGASFTLFRMRKNLATGIKRGIADVDELWKWDQHVVSGKFKRQNGSIILLSEAGEDAWRWNFTKAYPVKWSGPDLKADSGTVVSDRGTGS